jgi:predicted amidohydrolase YtcJ
MKLNKVIAISVLNLVIGSAYAQPADTVFINGKIITVDDKGAIHQALAVRQGRIVAVGKTNSIKK